MRAESKVNVEKKISNLEAHRLFQSGKYRQAHKFYEGLNNYYGMAACLEHLQDLSGLEKMLELFSEQELNSGLDSHLNWLKEYLKIRLHVIENLSEESYLHDIFESKEILLNLALAQEYGNSNQLESAYLIYKRIADDRNHSSRGM